MSTVTGQVTPASGEHHDGLVLPVAHRVALLSQRDGRHYPATVHSWLESSSGLVARVTVREGAALRLAGNRIWLSVAIPGRGFVVYSGRAQRGADTFLDLHDLEPVTREVRRRIAPRVSTGAAVTVAASQRPVLRTTALDLSRGGIRLAGSGTEPLPLGEHVSLDLALDGGAVRVRGQVARIDLRSGDTVVRFDGSPGEQRVALDRYVLARLGEESFSH